MTTTAPTVQMVKGLTFVTARRFVEREFGAEAFERLMAQMPASTRALFEDAAIDDWYEEAHMRTFIHALHRDLAGGDDERFMEIARELALAGISRFFRLVINLASARFVLKKVPVIWKRLRRGPATLQAVTTAEGHIEIHYRDFVYCADPIYRRLSMCNCQALVMAACDRVPPAQVVSWSADTMVLRFDPSADAEPA